MKLTDFLRTEGMTVSDFARAISVSPQSVSRYAMNQRIPDREIMNRITAATKGQVTANDFYNIQ